MLFSKLSLVSHPLDKLWTTASPLRSSPGPAYSVPTSALASSTPLDPLSQVLSILITPKKAHPLARLGSQLQRPPSKAAFGGDWALLLLWAQDTGL